MTKRGLPVWLVYDIETTPLKSWHFGLGKQVLRHTGLDNSTLYPKIICLCYQYSNSKKVHTLDWGEKGEILDVGKEFDKVIEHAIQNNILIVGKNNKRFDDKVLNTMRWINDNEPMPLWVKYTQDLEQKTRKYLRLPSQSLDAISKIKGLGGKERMDFGDWIDIAKGKQALQLCKQLTKKAADISCMIHFNEPVDVLLRRYKVAFDKIRGYCRKDVRDTMKILRSVAPHVDWQDHNIYGVNDGLTKCIRCSSQDLAKNGYRSNQQCRYQRFICNNCGYAGNRAIIKKNGGYGRVTC